MPLRYLRTLRSGMCTNSYATGEARLPPFKDLRTAAFFERRVCSGLKRAGRSFAPAGRARARILGDRVGKRSRQRRRSRGRARRDSAAYFLPTSGSCRAASGSLVIITKRLPQLEAPLERPPFNRR